MGDNLLRLRAVFEVTTHEWNRKIFIPLTLAALSSLVTHEASYLPFVFSRADASGSPPQPVKLRGRRTWNKRGQEVTEEARSFSLPLRAAHLTHKDPSLACPGCG